MIGKYYITSSSDGWCLGEFDHSKYPTKKLKGGYFDGPDAWLESPDPHDGALLFGSEKEAQKIVDLLEKDPFGEGEFYINRVEPKIEKTISLTEEQIAALVSTLQCTLDRASSYGSFGNNDTIFDPFVIKKVIEQLS